jgi:hypothetical protein
MYKICALLLLVNLNVAFAQLQNPSFEQTDSLGKLQHWNLKSGKATQLSSAQFGVIPFTPFDGNYFMLLESDTQTAIAQRGIIEQVFAFADTPGSISFPYFYIPESINQHAQIRLLFTKWNGTSRDTVLYLTDTLAAVADSNQIRIQWNTYPISLTDKYTQSILPDSAHLVFTNDDNLVAGKNIRLYLDKISFGKWAVGLKEQKQLSVELYPNPANQFVWIRTPERSLTFLLMGVDGKQYFPQLSQSTDGFQIDLNTIPNGLYFLQGTGNAQHFSKRILITHEN